VALVFEERVVHGPEVPLDAGRLGRFGRGEGMGVDLGEREMPEGEANTLGQLVLDTFDLPERSPRVRAFVVAVLEDDPPTDRTADVIDVLVQRLQWVRIPHRVGRHVRLLGPGRAAQKPTACRIRTTLIRPGCSWWISRTLPTRLCCP